ncbi:MAG: ATP-dependent Clp protease ATP-binding subunit [Candidatus Mcinerneyibacterium aminivorans]|uniref:ATP-dependent Clp protease ATP-binding subunit n=1 Tax=Candidatus Mcinerneyibacterium aminivorans TaxID=2703815 RepID=A0A5D0MHK4_9BACT|nr:MAG: ATP-dependent Clp protease ATP-binding subunit [Candidatus Mcinerneyibacterium aminivorans]
MYDKFSERARKIIIYAREEAAKLNYDFIGTEHLLLGLLREGASIGVIVLRRLEVEIGDLKESVKSYLIKENEDVDADHEIQLTPRSKRVLELAVREAGKMGHNFVGTEHILLGLILEGDGIAAKVLKNNGLTAKKIRLEIISLLSGDMEKKDMFKGRRRSKSTKGKNPSLEEYSRNLTELASKGKLDPVIGRDTEIERLMQILGRRKKNNPVLIGEAGVGKTAIVEGLAQRIVENDVPSILQGKKLISLDLPSIIAGTKYRGQFEQRLKSLLNEIQNSEEIIVFIDEMHTIVGAGAAEGAIDASNILKPSLARGEIQCIGATTLDEYRKYIEKDAALERRFQQVLVEPSTVEETIDILSGLRDRYEVHHAVKITDEAVLAAARLSERYLSDRFLPDKAIDLIDEAASMVRLTLSKMPKDIVDLKQKIKELNKDKNNAIMMQNFEKAAFFRDREKKLKEKQKELKTDWEQNQDDKEKKVEREDVAILISKWTGIPIAKIEEAETERLLKIEEELRKQIVGQDQAIKVVANALRRTRAGLKDPSRPIGAFMFLGPTGVGKTELARVLAEFMFDDSNALIRVDMSEYMEKFSVSRLTGAPPGYVGYEEGGQLTEKVRRKPYSVILLDEIEKAHPDVFNILLQVFEDGHLTDSLGRMVDFKNTIIIMTSNIGARYIWNNKRVGFSESSDEIDYEKMRDTVLNEAKKKFNPEFLNRLDELVVFNTLGKEEIREIIELNLDEVKERLKEKNMYLEVDSEVKDYLIEVGFNKEYGARPLRRSIRKHIEDVLALEILKNKFVEGDTIKVKMEDGDVITERAKDSILRGLEKEEVEQVDEKAD